MSAPGAAQAPQARKLVLGATRLFLLLQGLCCLVFWFLAAGNPSMAARLLGDTPTGHQLGGLDLTAQLAGGVAIALLTGVLIYLCAFVLGRVLAVGGYLAFLYFVFLDGTNHGLHPAFLEMAIAGGLACLLLVAATAL